MCNFDVVIIGSGIGGLVCADILGKEGLTVCVIEKNKQIGGSLQTFVRDRVIFDSGVHYIGGLSEGQNLHQIFKYLGIIDNLKLQKLDENVFDKIIIEGDSKEYTFAQGYENFIFQLLKDFPKEEKGLRLYCDKIKEVCTKFPLYNLMSGGTFNENASVLDLDTRAFIESITTNKKLQSVLVGNNMLYVLQSDKTPFYVHALILNSYIESSWKCINGGSAIGKLIAKNIRKQGGVIYQNTEVEKIIIEDGKAKSVQLKDGTRILGNNFISNIHPEKTLELTDTHLIKVSYKNRIKGLENSIGGFVVNIVFKKDSFKYIKHNFYYHKEGHIWSLVDYNETNWPLCYALFFSATSNSGEYAESMTILTYMKFGDVEQWGNTFNTVSAGIGRGEEYETFKKNKAEILINLVQKRFPELRDCIKSYYTATPLSFRDYIGNNDGAMYGIVKDYKNPLLTFISPRTKIPNLYLTGQNLHLHGILGATLSSLVTCTAFLRNENIINKIRNA
ncbi:MAG: NAD(P)/FAD-dependent oxidoreductase [Bacteroidetes bacterium]|nr:NAD(P)/FAD-dependent oxidoreductase [Bacteroidota bacterium]